MSVPNRLAVGVLLFALTRAVPIPLCAHAPPSIRLYVLDCGTMKERDGVPYGLSREQMAPRDLSDPCALVVHPRGTLLWETGLHAAANSIRPRARAAARAPTRRGPEAGWR